LREPNVENKYNLKPSDIKNLVILDREQIKEPLFWRNNVVNAWCISKEFGSKNDFRYGTENSVWIGIYDEDAKSYKNQIRFSCTCYGGMCSYNFNTFFSKNVKNEYDLQSQEFLLSTINELLDLGILGMPNRK